MLNISEHRVGKHIPAKEYSSLHKVESRSSGKVLKRLLSYSFGLLLITMLLPWTQNIQSRGNVTTLKPDQRPQTIESIIAGRIEKWYVQEGDFVHKGDTVLLLSEVKNEYLDPDLVGKTKEQLEAKKMTVLSYTQKVAALDNQISNLLKIRSLKNKQATNKLQQARLLVTSDSIDYQASIINYNIAEAQYNRMQKLQREGLKSLTDLEKRKRAIQKAQAEMISKENKLLASKNKVLNAQVELTSVQTQYNEKIAKAQSDKYTALSNKFNAEAMVTKLQNQLINYSLRNSMYYITAPVSGYITKAIQSGIGATIKAGEQIVSVMPQDYELAIAMYVKPIDLPLLQKGQHIRIQFDGWPAIVFSGWPNVSYGTYGGSIYAIDNFISPNGMYRVLVAQDENDHPWPEALRVGAGTRNMILLKDVMIGYEMWRKFNGFPPDYYKPTNANTPTNK